MNEYRSCGAAEWLPRDSFYPKCENIVLRVKNLFTS